ncbi:MAG: FctA domain-containing protein [Anaerovoracaceae bacterium]
MILKKMRKVIALIICAFLILISVTSSMAFAGNSGNRGDGSDPPISVKTYTEVYKERGEYLFSMDTDFVVVKQPYKYCYVWTKTELSEANQERIKAEIKEKDDQTVVPEGHFTFHFGYNEDFKISEDTKSKYFILRNEQPKIRLSILDSCHSPYGYGIPVAYGTFGTPPAKEAKAQIHLFKVLNGEEPGENKFQFNLKQVDENSGDINIPYENVAKNDENGDIIFKDIFYDISNGNQSRDYYYQVTESDTGIKGMTYDKEIETIKVSLTKNEDSNTWDTKTVYMGDRIFHNTYTTSDGLTGTANITLKKVLEGMELTAEMFDFELVQTDRDDNLIIGGYGDTSTNSPKGAINFSSIIYTTKDAGKTFYYRVTEKESKGLENIVYDNTPKTVEVKVADKATNGIYKVEVNYPKGDTFKNRYGKGIGSAVVKLEKKLTGKNIRLTDKMFQFNLVEVDEKNEPIDGGERLQTWNDSEGKIIFPKITYLENQLNKEFKYLVTEDSTKNIDGMTYSEEAFLITVKTTKNNGSYETNIFYPGGLTFHNSYKDPNAKGEAKIEFLKVMEGKKLTDEVFTFDLIRTDKLWYPAKIEYRDSKTNDKDGKICFNGISYGRAESGQVLYYLVKENVENKLPNIQYDEIPKRVEVRVAEESKNGVYDTTIKYLDGATFINKYIDPTIPVDPTGTIKITKDIKILRGSKTINQDFYVTLFQDEKFETKFKVNPTQKLSIVNSQSTAVSYANLPKGIYYIAETDKDGNVITKENIGAQSIAYSTQKVEIKENHLSDSVTITNSFVGDSPIIIPQYGSITVVKDLLKDGKPFATDKVFYTALFSEKELKNRVSEIKAIEMKNQSTAKVTFTYAKSGSLINIGETYYVAETDKLGNPITDPKSIGIDQIKLDNNIANISYSSLDPQIRITNIIVTAQPVDPSEPEQPTDPTDPVDPVEPTDPADTIDNDNIVQTSDNNPIVMWGMTFVVALLALLGVNLRKLKKNIH